MKRRRSDCRGEGEEYNGRNVKAGPVTISLSSEEPDQQQQQQINILALQRNLSPPLQLHKGINTLEDKHLLSLHYLLLKILSYLVFHTNHPSSDNGVEAEDCHTIK